MSEKTEIQSAFELGRLSTAIQQIGKFPFLVTPEGAVKSLAHFLENPLAIEKTTTFDTIQSFIDYVNRFKNSSTSIYVNPEIKNPAFRAVLDHSEIEIPRREVHAAAAALTSSEALTAWLKFNKQAIDQETFADLLEDRAIDISEPESAAIIEIARDLHVTKNVAVSSVLRSGNGHAIKFSTEQQVKSKGGEVEIPKAFTIRIKPYKFQDAAVDIRAILRVKIVSDHPLFVFEFQRLDEQLKTVIDAIVAHVKEKTGVVLYV